MLHNNVLIRCYGCFARNIILTVVFFFITFVLLIRRGVRVFRWLEGRRTSVPKHSATEAPHAACKYDFPRLSTGHDLTRWVESGRAGSGSVGNLMGRAGSARVFSNTTGRAGSPRHDPIRPAPEKRSDPWKAL